MPIGTSVRMVWRANSGHERQTYSAPIVRRSSSCVIAPALKARCNVRSHEDVFRFFVSPYHPDSLRVPLTSPVVDGSDRLRHALTWNVFRTLEQIAPSFWTRPLIAALGGLADHYASAPHVCRVHCWHQLEPPPAAMLRRGRRAPVRADVLICTDDTLISVLVPSVAEVTSTVLSDTAEGGMLDLIEATCHRAGMRSAYTAVVLPPGADGEVWRTRVNRRGLAVRRVLQASTRAVANARGAGALTWSDLGSILADAGHAPALHTSERVLAEATARWMEERLLRNSEHGLLA